MSTNRLGDPQGGRSGEGLSHLTELIHEDAVLRKLHVGEAARPDEVRPPDQSAACAQHLEMLAARGRHAKLLEVAGQLAGPMGHHFNNLLQGLTGYLHLLQRRLELGKLDDAGQLVSRALITADRGARLMHSLLAFSGQQPLSAQIIDVNALLQRMEGKMLGSWPADIHIRLVLAADLWKIDCDATQLPIAIQNLCDNAREAMPNGGELVIDAVNVSTGEAAGCLQDCREYVCLGVQDNGVGMPPSAMARAFEPFYTTKQMGLRPGLGLSATYGFAKQSGGWVALFSELGQGTKARLYLPRSCHDAEELEPVETSLDGRL